MIRTATLRSRTLDALGPLARLEAQITRDLLCDPKLAKGQKQQAFAMAAGLRDLRNAMREMLELTDDAQAAAHESAD